MAWWAHVGGSMAGNWFRSRNGLALVVVSVLSLKMPGDFSFRAAEFACGLEFRQVVNGSLAPTGTPVPRDAVEVFVYEGEPAAMHVGENDIAVDYGQSACLFDRQSGKMTRRFTLADGWPRTRPAVFGPFVPRHRRRPHLIGPGVVTPWGQEYETHAVAAEISFKGRTWRALQPARFLSHLSKGMDGSTPNEELKSWTGILEKLNAASWVEALSGDGTVSRTYTTLDGLPSNMVTHFAASRGVLWAACVDIYDREKDAWGPGGLCRYDEAKDRWERIDAIEGRLARWVTLLQGIDDELWVGFREGSGVDGDAIGYGRGGPEPGDYRPKVTAMVLARLREGIWTVFSRAPLENPTGPFTLRVDPSNPPSSTERPCRLVRQGDQVFLFSQIRGVGLGGGWNAPLDGCISRLNLRKGEWKVFDAKKHLDADVVTGCVMEQGEVLIATDIGAHQWDERTQSWRYLDTEYPLRNPALSAAAEAGDELWVGYTNQSFGLRGQQGISRFNEKTGKWSYMTPDVLGTGCPVRRLVALPNGEVWVLFASRAQVELPYFPRGYDRPSVGGVGRFANGGWTFPAVLEGVPATTQWEEKMADGSVRRVDVRARIENLVVLGDRLFVTNRLGVFMGPDPWRRICSNPQALDYLDIELAPDDDALLITCYDQKLRQETTNKVLQARYVLGDADVKFEVVSLKFSYSYSHVLRLERGYLLSKDVIQVLLSGGVSQDFGRWARVPVRKEGVWVIGPYPEYFSTTARVFQTHEAVWIASRGQLIRLDRGKLWEWSGADGSSRGSIGTCPATPSASTRWTGNDTTREP